jgi:hypothetical protein
MLRTHLHAHVAGKFPQEVFRKSGGIGKKVLSFLFSGLYHGRAIAQAVGRWHRTSLRAGLSAGDLLSTEWQSDRVSGYFAFPLSM